MVREVTGPQDELTEPGACGGGWTAGSWTSASNRSDVRTAWVLRWVASWLQARSAAGERIVSTW